MAERDFLLFRLAGPMAAWGDITVGERRSIWGEPSKSAVLGLIAASQGARRDEDDRHDALETGLGFAVRIDAPGRPLRDYHTAQAPKVRRNLSWRTRRDELADRENLNTVLSERLYRLEARATVALWRKAGDLDLNALAEALRRPRFTLSLGRKACPLGEPAWPLVLNVDGLAAAFHAYDAQRDVADNRLPTFARRYRHTGATACPVWFEMDAGLAEDEAASPIRQRRDSIRRRSQHSFTDRREGRLMWSASATPADLLEGIVA